MGVKEGVREARKASDLGTAGDTMVETRPKSGHSDANVAPMHASPSLKVGHSAPGTGMECGLEQPRMESGAEVTGATKNKHRKENKRKRIAKQLAQDPVGYWRHHRGEFRIPEKAKAKQKMHMMSTMPLYNLSYFFCY